MAIYKTAVHGVPVDMDKLRLQNQKEIALGNMGTNARGDVLGKGGKILETREEVIEKFYESNPELNPRAVVNLKKSPKENVSVKEDLDKINAPTPAPTVNPSPRSRKKSAPIAETFNIEDNTESE